MFVIGCFVLFSLTTIAAGDGLGKGIVTKTFQSGDSNSKPRMGWTGEPEMLHYHHYVECDYIHVYEYGKMRKFRFELFCLSFAEVNGAPDYTVFINYDYNVLDRFSVTSCKAEDVINSIFPPRQRKDYPDKDDNGLPDTHHLRYRTDDGKCWDRKYSFVNRISTMAKRHDPEPIDCPSDKDEWFNPTKGEFDHFGNCRVPKVPVPHNVIDWHTKAKPMDWFPDLNDDGSRKYKRLLECDWDRVTKEWKIVCVQMEETSELLAFVSRDNEQFDRFTVKSCEEQTLVNSIFVNRFTTFNKGSEYGTQYLYFAAVEEQKCYERGYDDDEDPSEPKDKPCPKTDDDWVNPTAGFAGMFGHCKVPEIKEVKKEVKDLKLADKPGLVTRPFPSGGKGNGVRMGWTGEPEMLKYKHYVECDYIHNYPYPEPYMRKFRFELHCLSFGTVNGAPDYTVFIDYDYNVLDRFNVTSCNTEDVINSIFIPRQRADYPDTDTWDLPNSHHIRYITTDHMCHDRKYEFMNRKSIMATRLDPEDISCPSNFDEWLNPTTGWFAKFGNCRVPIVPVPRTVVDWATKETPKDWYPGHNDGNKKHKQLLKCDWDRLSSIWEIVCVKVEGEEHYKAFVSRGGLMKDRFTVTSCKEEYLVNSIFPPRFTTAHPHGAESLRFAAVKNKEGNELCYQRIYSWRGSFEDPKIIACPEYDDDWVNPTEGFAGMFGHCEVLGTEESLHKPLDGKTTEPHDSEQTKNPEMTGKETEAHDMKKEEDKSSQKETHDKVEPAVQQH